MEGELNETLLSKVEAEGSLKTKIREENKKMWVVVGPAIFTRFTTFGINVISQAFIGKLGAREIAAYELPSNSPH